MSISICRARLGPVRVHFLILICVYAEICGFLPRLTTFALRHHPEGGLDAFLGYQCRRFERPYGELGIWRDDLRHSSTIPMTHCWQ